MKLKAEKIHKTKIHWKKINIDTDKENIEMLFFNIREWIKAITVGSTDKLVGDV